MHLKPSALSIEPTDPFGADQFGLSEFGMALTHLVKATPQSFVVNLEAPWGRGKSTFLQMWRHQLKAEGVESVGFNAWETDFTNDPVVSLIGELTTSLSEMSIAEESKAGRQLKRVRQVGIGVIKRALPAAIKIGTAGLLDLSDLSEETLGDLGKTLAEERLGQYEAAKRSISGFREELEKFSTALATEKKSRSPLVIIVDELDRCRPDYAIKVLEAVKHLFSVPGVFFVVATDSNQLSNAIKHTYGLDVSSEGYLRRFFDLSIALPAPSTSKSVAALFDRFGLTAFFEARAHPELRYDKQQTVAAFCGLFDATNSSLRDQEKCFTLLSLAARGLPENHYLHPLLLCTLIVLQIKNRSLYDSFVEGSTTSEEVLGYFTTTSAGRLFFFSDRGYSSVIEAYLLVARSGRHATGDVLLRLRQQKDSDSIDQAQRDRASRILEVLESFDFRKAHGSLSAVLPRIELVARAMKEADV